MLNTTIQYDNIIIIIIIAPASTRPARTLEAEARTLEAEARTLEAKVEAKAEFIQFWPSEL